MRETLIIGGVLFGGLSGKVSEVDDTLSGMRVSWLLVGDPGGLRLLGGVISRVLP